MQEKEKFKCTHEGCDYSTNKAGYLKNHETQKHGTERKSEKKNDEVKSGLCECGGRFRLLSSSEKKRVEAQSFNYKKVCMSCDELK